MTDLPPLNPDQLAAIRERWERRYLANRKAAPLAVACADVGCLLRSHAALAAELDRYKTALEKIAEPRSAYCNGGDYGEGANNEYLRLSRIATAALEGKPRE